MLAVHPSSRRYKRDYFSFEALTMIRTFVLTGALALMPQGTTGQLLVGMLVTFIFMMAGVTPPSSQVQFWNQD